MTHSVLVIGSYEFTKRGISTLLSFSYGITLAVKNEEKSNLKKLSFPLDKLTIIYYDSINDQSFLEELKQQSFDYIAIFSLSKKVPSSIINLAKVAAINFHPSLLPNYRGPDPYYWVLHHKETQTGLTAHFLTDEWDQGDIIEQISFDISPYETYDSLKTKTFNHIAPLLKTMKPSLDSKQLSGTKQGKGSYFKEKDVKDYEINWNLAATEIDHLIRCNHTNTPPFIFLANKMIQILEVKLTPHKSEQPGKITVRNNQLHIGTGDWDLELAILVDNYAVFSGTRFLRYYNFI